MRRGGHTAAVFCHAKAHTRMGGTRMCMSILVLLNTLPHYTNSARQPGNAAPPATARQNEHTHSRVHLIYKTPADTHTLNTNHMSAGAHALPKPTSTTTPVARDVPRHVHTHPTGTHCVHAHLVLPGSVSTSSQPHADGGPPLCIGKMSPPGLSNSPMVAGRCPQSVLRDLLLPGVVGVAGITHPWGEGHLFQQLPAIRASFPALLPMPGVTTRLRDISEEAAGA